MKSLWITVHFKQQKRIQSRFYLEIILLNLCAAIQDGRKGVAKIHSRITSLGNALQKG